MRGRARGVLGWCVVAVLEEVSGEGAAADAFGEMGGPGSLFECFLESAFVEMIALPNFGIGVLDAATRGKTHCQIHSRSVFGYSRSRAKGIHADP